jgi:tol-pal system protein YbgF
MWLVAILAGLLATAWPAVAADTGAMRSDLDHLRDDIAALRPAVLAQLQEPTVRAAELEVRLSRLEEELRQLTGRLEEVEHAQRLASARMDALVADLDARLPGGGGTAAAAPRPTPPPVAATAAPSQPTTRESIIAPDAAARQGYVLGTIPEDAVRGQPAVRTPTLPTPSQDGAQARLQPEGADSTYKGALDLLQAGKWGDAEQEFTAFVKDYPNDPRAPTASYWLGETYFFRKDYPTAASVFARNYRTYGEAAPRAPDNLLKLGMSLAAMGDRDRACQTFGELSKRHANAPAPIRQALSRERSAAGCN